MKGNKAQIPNDKPHTLVYKMQYVQRVSQTMNLRMSNMNISVMKKESKMNISMMKEKKGIILNC